MSFLALDIMDVDSMKYVHQHDTTPEQRSFRWSLQGKTFQSFLLCPLIASFLLGGRKQWLQETCSDTELPKQLGLGCAACRSKPRSQALSWRDNPRFAQCCLAAVRRLRSLKQTVSVKAAKTSLT